MLQITGRTRTAIINGAGRHDDFRYGINAGCWLLVDHCFYKNHEDSGIKHDFGYAHIYIDIFSHDSWALAQG